MIVLRAVRVEDNGAETELGEVRLTEVGVVYSHMSTAAGEGVMRDLRERLRETDPAKVADRNAGRHSAHALASPYDLNALGRERAARRGW